MQPGDTSFSDETTGVLLFDEWTPTGGPDFFADDHTTTTWISVANTWADVDEATRRMQSQDAANLLHRMAAPQIDWDGDDSTTQTWGHQHLATLSNAMFRAPPRTLETRGASEADLASARLRARARSNTPANQRSQPPSAADLASARLRARARASQPAQEAYAARVATPVSASPRVAKVLSTPATEAYFPATARAAIPAATPTLRTAPFVARAPVTQPVAPRLTTRRVASLVSLPINRVEVQPDTWLVPRTQSQLVLMTLVPGVALFAAVLVARVLLATAGPALSPSPTLVRAPSEQAAPLQQSAPVQQTPESAAPVVVPPVQTAPLPTAPQTKVTHAHHEHTSATPTHRDDHSDDVAPNMSQRSVTATVQGEGILRINSRPWAEVFVDGALVGHTPQPNLHLSAGAHQVELINRPMGMSKALRVQIRPGETETQIINLIE